MDKKYNGFNNGRDTTDGVGGREVNHGTPGTMTKEQILTKHGILNRELFIKDVSTIHLQIGKEKYNSCLNAMSEWESQQLSAERERAGKLIGALNEYIVLLGEELDEVMGFVNAHQWKSTRFEKGEELRQKIKQTLNEYDTATKS